MSVIQPTSENAGEALTVIKEESVLASLGLNGQLFVFQLFNFALVAAIVWWLILKPLTKKMEERKQIVEDSLTKADEINTRLMMSEKKYQEKIDEAKMQANHIIETAHNEAVSLAEKIKIQAKQEIETVVGQAREKIQRDREQMKAEIKEELAGVVVAAVEKILDEKMDDKKDAALIAETLTKINF